MVYIDPEKWRPSMHAWAIDSGKTRTTTSHGSSGGGGWVNLEDDKPILGLDGNKEVDEKNSTFLLLFVTFLLPLGLANG